MLSRICSTLAALVLAQAFAWAAAAEMLVVHAPNDGYLNLRTGPGSGYAVVIEMDHGSMVDTLEYAGSWARVRHESGNTGWAYRKYMVKPATGPDIYRVYSPGDGYLNLRTGPGTGFAIVQRMYNGSRVEVVERAGKWARVYHEDGAEGWASTRYLRR